MSPGEIAEHVADVVEAMRKTSELYRRDGNAFVAGRMLDPEIIAAAVRAYLDSKVRA